MKNTFRLFFMFAVAAGLILLVSAHSLPSARAAGPWYVSNSGNDSNDCASSTTPCSSINGALNKPGFVAGDTINVAIGTYTGSGTEVVLLNKNTTLSGGWDASFTTQSGMSTVDGQKSGLVVKINSGVTTTIERFTIQNGYLLGYDECGCAGINNFGTLTLNNSTVKNNTGAGIGNWGTMVITNVTVSDNTGGMGGGGGGIHNGGGMTINNSTILRNRSGSAGGGIVTINTGNMTLNNSTIKSNTARSSGGGIALWGASNAVVTINNSSIVDNISGENGGGISGWAGSYLTLNNSTVSNNIATGQGEGGGVYVGGSLAFINSSTISQNTAGNQGGGITRGGAATLQNTIVAGNTTYSTVSPDCSGGVYNDPFTSLGDNLIGNTSGCNFPTTTGDLTNVNPQLGQLLDTLGYHPLMSASPAINAGNPSGCNGSTGLLTTDQRGANRVGRCDIGAYEYTTPGSAARIVAIDGTPQRTAPSIAFAKPLRAAVIDSMGSPVANVTVTFTSPSTGASGTFADSGTNTTTATTNASGIATAATLTANAQTGTYGVSASGGGATPTNFSLTHAGWYVAPSGSDSNDCQTIASPCATISSILKKTGFVPYDTVLIATGIYTGTDAILLNINKHIRLLGGWNASFTAQSGYSTLDGETVRQVLSVEGGIVANGERFILQNGIGGPWITGGGIGNFGILTFNNGVIRNNRSDPTVSGAYGGGINNAGDLTLNKSTVSDNGSQDGAGPGGGIFNTGNLFINNSTISGNKGSFGGGIANGSGFVEGGRVYIFSSTLSDNTALSGGGIANSSSMFGVISTVTLKNSIVTGNFNKWVPYNSPNCYGAINTLGYNLIANSPDCSFTPGTGDLTNANANLGLLINTPGYHPLLSASSAINAGDPAGCTDYLGNLLSTDQRGATRVGRCDMGAYEYTIPGTAASVLAMSGTPQRTPPTIDFWLPLQVLVVDNIGTPISNATVTFYAPISGASGKFANTGTATTSATTNPSGLTTASTFTANNQFGSYLVSATVSGATPGYFQLSNFGWYVSPTGNDTNSCQTPVSACATVNGTLAQSGFASNDTVLIGAGTYTGIGDQVVLLDKNARLWGGWNGTFTMRNGTTILDGQNARNVVYVTPLVTALIERLTIQNGNAVYANSGVGGGIRNDGSLILNESTIMNNYAYSAGGGLYNKGILLINKSTISGNSNASQMGGGLYNYSPGSVTFNNSTISGNAGGGVVNSGTLYANNSTVSSNTYSQVGTGAGINNNTSLQMTFFMNTILAGNTNSSGQPADCSGTLTSQSYNLVQDTTGCTINGNTTGNQTGINPNLGSLQNNSGPTWTHALLAGSPAINAGNPAGCADNLGNPLNTDQRGASRVGRCDIGAFEYGGIIIGPYRIFLPFIKK